MYTRNRQDSSTPSPACLLGKTPVLLVQHIYKVGLHGTPCPECIQEIDLGLQYS